MRTLDAQTIALHIQGEHEILTEYDVHLKLMHTAQCTQFVFAKLHWNANFDDVTLAFHYSEIIFALTSIENGEEVSFASC